MRRNCVLTITLAASVLFGAHRLGPEKGLDTITAGELKADLYYLASDAMSGRNTNTVQNQMVAEFIAQRFEAAGLEGGGRDGSFFHKFNLVETSLAEGNQLSLLSESGSEQLANWTVREDFYPYPFSAVGEAAAPAVFAGYGISAPEYGYDDYRDFDAAGKIVVVIDHEPLERVDSTAFLGKVASKHSDPLEKTINAQRHGAVGFIVVPDLPRHPDRRGVPEVAGVWPERGNVRNKRYQLEVQTAKVRIPVVRASADFLDVLTQGSTVGWQALIEKLDRLESVSFVLGRKLKVRTSLSRKLVPERNVVALLRGSDAALSREAVVIGAHFDHVGSDGAQVWNGADDDGSGTVALLEIAEAFASNGARPKRTVIFAAWNAEEKGLLGARYYVEHPSMPLSKTVAMLQMDMIGRDEEVPDTNDNRFRGLPRQTAKENGNSVNVLGYSYVPNLQEIVQTVNRPIGLDLKFRYDDGPQGLLRRSDHWPFLLAGVPAAFFHTGLHPDYHTPKDKPNRINYPKLEKITKLVYLLAWELADGRALLRYKKRE